MDSTKSNTPRLHQWVNNLWYSDNKVALLLLPISGLFFLVSQCRRVFQKHFPGIYTKFTVPVIVVGNITVGGSGKTPMVIHLANELSSRGYRVGISSRGYGRHNRQTLLVDSHHHSSDVGDEPLLIYSNTQCSVVVGEGRKANIHMLINDSHCDLVICDDGLQDYRFQHDVEIIMIDGQRIFGNGFLLPAGPLRESVQRLNSSNFNVVTNQVIPAISSDYMHLQSEIAKNLVDSSEAVELTAMKNKKVHAIAGIANPDRFFTMLESYGIQLLAHPMPDHYEYSVSDFEFDDDLPIFMTEKDAVKCRHINLQNVWFVPVTSVLPDSFVARVQELIKR